MNKLCHKCQTVKCESEFPTSRGVPTSPCKQCKHIRQIQHRHENLEAIRLREKERYYINYEQRRQYQREWDKRNIEKVRGYKRKAYAKSLTRRISSRLRSRVRKAISSESTRVRDIQELIGCSVDQLIDHLKAQFSRGMNWNHFKAGRIHIDHIKPCAAFDLSKPKQQRACFHFTNLQPLWAVDNYRKGARTLCKL